MRITKLEVFKALLLPCLVFELCKNQEVNSVAEEANDPRYSNESIESIYKPLPISIIY